MAVTFPHTFAAQNGPIPLSQLDDNFTAVNTAIGTAAGNLVALDGSAKLPAVDGSQLINLPIPTVTSGTYNSTFTFNGAGGTSASTTITWQKIGNFITLRIPGTNATTGTNSSVFTSNTAAPAGIRPPGVLQYCCVAELANNGAAVATPGLLLMNTTGVITVYRDGTGSNFTNSALAGFSDQTFTYCIA